jgi:hypothetical protein
MGRSTPPILHRDVSEGNIVWQVGGGGSRERLGKSQRGVTGQGMAGEQPPSTPPSLQRKSPGAYLELFLTSAPRRISEQQTRHMGRKGGVGWVQREGKGGVGLNWGGHSAWVQSARTAAENEFPSPNVSIPSIPPQNLGMQTRWKGDGWETKSRHAMLQQTVCPSVWTAFPTRPPAPTRETTARLPAPCQRTLWNVES